MAGRSDGSEPEYEGKTPTWLYVGGALLIAVALVFVAMHLTSGEIPRH